MVTLPKVGLTKDRASVRYCRPPRTPSFIPHTANSNTTTSNKVNTHPTTNTDHHGRHSPISRRLSRPPGEAPNTGSPPSYTHRLYQPQQPTDVSYIQLDALRSTIPNLVSPLIKPQTSKAHMFAEVKKTAVTSTSQLTAFRDDWNSEQTQQIFTKAQESERKDRDLSKAQEVAAFGWAQRTETES
jgi:hypothetical protein